MKTLKDFEETLKTVANRESIEDFWCYVERAIEYKLKEDELTGKRMIDLMSQPVVCIPEFWHMLINKNNFIVVNDKLKENGYKLTWHSVFGYRIYFDY